ncbi:helicase-related protein [Kitasatospora aureofaciens]|uniref:helicase-related protein n=1 Tax=Kitasatospora aureofaciens TaxID=1894 RepID=UPI0033DC4E39
MITFHSRVAGAREFAADLPAAAALLKDADRPERIWAKAVAGTDRLRDRRQAFAEFKAHSGDDGEECGILCNSRLLTEGIDVAAVDAVCFADPKSSVSDIVQAVGRALRQSYRQGKVSWVIVPVYRPTPLVGDETAGADPAEVHDASVAVKAEADTEVEASSFRTIWRVLRALAAHDARVVGRITELRAHRARSAPLTTEASAAEGEAAEAGAGEQPAAEQTPVDWLRIDARRHAARILQTVKLRVFNPRASEWRRMHAVAARFHLEHGHLDPTDREKHGELISWLDRQRYLNGQGLLDRARPAAPAAPAPLVTLMRSRTVAKVTRSVLSGPVVGDLGVLPCRWFSRCGLVGAPSARPPVVRIARSGKCFPRPPKRRSPSGNAEYTLHMNDRRQCRQAVRGGFHCPRPRTFQEVFSCVSTAPWAPSAQPPGRPTPPPSPNTPESRARPRLPPLLRPGIHDTASP